MAAYLSRVRKLIQSPCAQIEARVSEFRLIMAMAMSRDIVTQEFVAGQMKKFSIDLVLIRTILQGLEAALSLEETDEDRENITRCITMVRGIETLVVDVCREFHIREPAVAA